MTDKERPEIEPHLLSPDYWDGHGPEDECGWKEASGRRDIPFRKELGAPGFGRKVLKDFFSTEATPVRTFVAGELFNANEYPEGTVIKYEDERLYIQSSSKWMVDNPYYRKDRWGVVFGYDHEKQREKAIVIFTAWSPPMKGFLSWGRVIGPTIRVREVEHTRIDRKDFKRESLERVNGLVLYKIGKGIREKERKGFRLPDFGVIFGRKPQAET